MEFLHLLRDISTPVLDKLFLAITFLGDETFFIIIGLLVFWCIDKYEGYYVLSVGFIGTIVNQFLKIVCRIPRPWVRDPSLSVAEGAKSGAGGFSFPSGHTQSSVGSFGSIAVFAKNKGIRIAAIVLCVLVPFSRMYLGVHTPADVLVSYAIALLLIFAVRPIVKKGKQNPAYMWGLIGFMAALSVAFLVFMEFFAPESLSGNNYTHAYENAYTLTGCVLGICVVYFVDSKYTHFETAAPFVGQVLKLVLGTAVAFIIKEGLRAPLAAVISHEGAARLVRYFLLVVAAGAVWPTTFGFFSKIKNKNKIQEEQ
ncbi:MAG: phosphatase PAP2 family protein [Clostridia bacterium]|nr:phosphatase PAP2 family protein [Clostridia bacterium]